MCTAVHTHIARPHYLPSPMAAEVKEQMHTHTLAHIHTQTWIKNPTHSYAHSGSSSSSSSRSSTEGAGEKMEGGEEKDGEVSSKRSTANHIAEHSTHSVRSPPALALPSHSAEHSTHGMHIVRSPPALALQTSRSLSRFSPRQGSSGYGGLKGARLLCLHGGLEVHGGLKGAWCMVA